MYISARNRKDVKREKNRAGEAGKHWKRQPFLSPIRKFNKTETT